MDEVVATLAKTTMSFDVVDNDNTNFNRLAAAGGGGALAQPEWIESSTTTTTTTTAPIQEMDNAQQSLQQEGGYYINTTAFNIFESEQFLTAMGGDVSEASLATNYIRTGDSLLKEESTVDHHHHHHQVVHHGHYHHHHKESTNDNKETKEQHKLERAIQVYYAGLGVILSRVREWSMERRESDDVPLDESPVKSTAPGGGPLSETTSLLYKDFCNVAHSTETNILLLSISSILLRAGNAHFRLEQYEAACRDYGSAQSYQSTRHEAKHIMSAERKRYSVLHVEDAKLNGRISNNLASAQSKRGMYDEARMEYTRALQMKQGTLEGLHKHANKKDVDDKNLVADIASTFNNIGLLRMECGEPKKAEKAYKQSLSLRVKKFGLDDLGVSSTLSALGDLYYHQKQYDDAFRSYKESLRIWKSHRKKSDMKTAEHYYNIGLVFYSKGPYAKAKSSIAECLRIRRHAGNETLPVASALYMLGLIARALGNYDEASTQLQDALHIRQKLLQAKDNLLVLNVQLALGTVHQKLNDFDSAMECFSTVLIGREQRLGRDHISVSEVLQAIGVTYTAAHQYQKAYQTLEEALRIRKASTGHIVEVAETLNALSYVHFKTDDTEKALELSEEALELLKTAVGFDHELVGKTLKNAGDYYQDMGSYEDALEAYSESLRVMMSWFGRDHIFLSEVLNEIGVTRFKNGDYVNAKDSFTEVRSFLINIYDRIFKMTDAYLICKIFFPAPRHFVSCV